MFRHKGVRQFTDHCGVRQAGRLIALEALHLAGSSDRHLPTSEFPPNTICERITQENWFVHHDVVHIVERLFHLLFLTRRQFILPIFLFCARRASIPGEVVVVLKKIKTRFPCQLESGALNSSTFTRRHVAVNPPDLTLFVVPRLPRSDEFAKSHDALASSDHLKNVCVNIGQSGVCDC